MHKVRHKFQIQFAKACNDQYTGSIYILNRLFMLYNYCKKNLKISLTVAKREAFLKGVKKWRPQMHKSKIVQHFVKEEISRNTLYNSKNRLATGDCGQEAECTLKPPMGRHIGSRLVQATFEVRGHKIGHLYQRVLGKKAAPIHPRASS